MKWFALALLVLCSAYISGAVAQERAIGTAPPQRMRMCIGPDACANLVWNGDHYDGRGDNAADVSSRYWIMAWGPDRVELQGKTTAAVDGQSPAEGVFTGKISPQGDSLTDTADDWRIGNSQSGSMSFTLTWEKSAANVIGLTNAPAPRPPSRASGQEYPPTRACQSKDCQQFLQNILTTETATNVAQWRKDCAGGWMPDAIEKSRKQGVDMPDAVDVCVAVLTRTAHDGNLLMPYQKGEGVGVAEAELLVNVNVTTAKIDTAPFQPTGDRETMWTNGTMTPSLEFEMGFIKGYRAKAAGHFDQGDMVNVRINSSRCLEQQLSNSICSTAGLIQGASAYRQSAK